MPWDKVSKRGKPAAGVQYHTIKEICTEWLAPKCFLPLTESICKFGGQKGKTTQKGKGRRNLQAVQQKSCEQNVRETYGAWQQHATRQSTHTGRATAAAQ